MITIIVTIITVEHYFFQLYAQNYRCTLGNQGAHIVYNYHDMNHLPMVRYSGHNAYWNARKLSTLRIFDPYSELLMNINVSVRHTKRLTYRVKTFENITS